MDHLVVYAASQVVNREDLTRKRLIYYKILILKILHESSCKFSIFGNIAFVFVAILLFSQG